MTLGEQVTARSSLLPDGEMTLPVGTFTDGASIPRPFRWAIGQPYWPPFWVAALFHDVLYRERIGKRKDADDLFYELLIADGVGRIRARLMWAALRAFAWYHWHT